MALLVLTFIPILLATFLLVIAMTRQSPEQKIVRERMALIHISQKDKAVAGSDSTQLLKATRTSRLAWADEILGRFEFAKALQVRIQQARSSTSVAGLILTSVGLFIFGSAITWLFAPMVLLDLAVGVSLSLLPFGILSLKRSRRVNAFNEALPVSLASISCAI